VAFPLACTTGGLVLGLVVLRAVWRCPCVYLDPDRTYTPRLAHTLLFLLEGSYGVLPFGPCFGLFGVHSYLCCCGGLPDAFALRFFRRYLWTTNVNNGWTTATVGYVRDTDALAVTFAGFTRARFA